MRDFYDVRVLAERRVFDGATLCNVSVVATPPKSGRLVAAAFAY
jgi:hypothetical protein